MFDSVYIWMNCPYCRDYESIELQTKNLDKVLAHYESVDLQSIVEAKKNRYYKKYHGSPWKSNAEISKEFGDNLKYIKVTGDCHSPKCQFDSDRRDIIMQGCPLGFGRTFDAKIKIKKFRSKYYLYGKPYDIIKDDNTEEKLKDYKKHLKKDVLKKFEEFTKKSCSR